VAIIVLVTKFRSAIMQLAEIAEPSLATVNN